MNYLNKINLKFIDWVIFKEDATGPLIDTSGWQMSGLTNNCTTG
jgi:hypothetical protein